MGQGALLDAREHPGQFPHPAGIVERHHSAAGHRTVVSLRHHQVPVREGRNLRQVSDTDHLMGPREPSQPAADLDRGTPTHPGVDLVEHHCRGRVGGGEHDLDGQHDPRQLTAGGPLVHRACRCARMRHQAQFDLVSPGRPIGDELAVHGYASGIRALGDNRLDPGPGHRQPRKLGGHRRGEPVRGGTASHADLSGMRAEVSHQPVSFGCQFPGPVAIGVDLKQASPGLLRPCQDPRQIGAVRSGKARESRLAGLHGGKAARIGLDAGRVGGEVRGDVGEQHPDFVQAVSQIGKILVEGRLRGDQPMSGAQQVDGARRIVTTDRGVAHQHRVRAAGGLHQRLGVFQPAQLGVHRRVLAGIRVDSFDLREAAAQDLRLGRPLPGPFGDLGEQAGDPAQSRVDGGVSHQRPLHRGTREPVEGTALLTSAQQPLLVGLAVHRDQPVGDLGEETGRDGPTADVRPGAAFLGQGPADEQAVVVALAARVPDPFGQRAAGRGDQPSVDEGPPRAGTHQTGIRTPAGEKPEPLDNHGLASAGLTADHGETGRELEHGVVDDPEAANANFLEHRRDSMACPVLGNGRTRDPGLGDGHRPRRSIHPRQVLVRPRQPVTGRSNLATSRSVNGRGCTTASRTGRRPRVTSTRERSATSTERRPSQDSTAGVEGSTSMATDEVGASTRGRANRAWALIGATSRASTPGHRTGPPTENAYAVDPVGVEQIMPSQPHRDSGRLSTSTTHSSIRDRSTFSSDTSLRAQPRYVGSPW